mgnify:CR=1 FL=1
MGKKTEKSSAWHDPPLTRTTPCQNLDVTKKELITVTAKCQPKAVEQNPYSDRYPLQTQFLQEFSSWIQRRRSQANQIKWRKKIWWSWSAPTASNSSSMRKLPWSLRPSATCSLLQVTPPRPLNYLDRFLDTYYWNRKINWLIILSGSLF